MRNIFFLALAILLLVGCSSPVAPSPKEDSKVGKTLYFLAANNSDPFYEPGVRGFMDAAEALGWKAQFVGPMEASTELQMQEFETLANSKGTGGIFWYAMDFNVGEPILEQAQANGIPVVIGAADSPFKERRAFVGYNNTILGQQAASWASKLVGCNGPVGTISINGANVEERVSAFNDYIKEICPDIEVVERAAHDGSAANAAATIDAYMIAHPDLTLLWFADGGAGQQVQTWQEQISRGVSTLFLATDMPEATLEAIRDDIFVGTVGQDTYTEEYWGVVLLDALARGQRVPDTLYLSAILIDATNVDEFLSEK